MEKPRISERLIGALAFGFLAMSCVGTASAQEQGGADYKNKTITIIAGFSPGGGYDAYDRLLASHFSLHVPGNPNVVVQNMPGAGSLTAARSLARTQPRDGTVLLTFNPGLVTQSLVEPEKVGLDFRSFAWIGIFTPDFRVCWGFGADGVSSWSDLMKRKQFAVGTTGKGAGAYINGAMLRDILGAPIKHILGFPGSAEQRIAIERGELDGDCGTYSSIPSDWLRDNKARPFVRFTRERPAWMPEGAVFVNDLATTDEQRRLLDFFDTENEIGRVLIASRDVPAERIAILRRAFDETMRDPAFLADATRLGLPVNPRSGAETQKIFEAIVGAPPELIQAARKIFED